MGELNVIAWICLSILGLCSAVGIVLAFLMAYQIRRTRTHWPRR